MSVLVEGSRWITNKNMRLVIFTSNALRHKFVANSVASVADDVLIVSECRPSNVALSGDEIALHFQLRAETEKKFFGEHATFRYPVLPIMYKEANAQFVYDIVKEFNPDVGVVYGSCIIGDPLLRLIPQGRFINLHLGMSPYYRGSGTNFWPFVNDELEYVGSTLLHIDAGIDTGDIIKHVRPEWEDGDTVHMAGNKVIKKSAAALVGLLGEIRDGKKLNRVKQWDVSDERYYKKKDFDEVALKKYYENIEGGMVQRFVGEGGGDVRVIE